ncbi:nucleotidyl transferase AbiEii/AbiGii toxin family protein [Actinomadura flavalba]|uniref:nucleotidyl transferase AbiEii/AbiGii toxin family protein n=1 Tax=Actinomadura flavalba TaxID=1120938 RepID=UPI000368AF46|nr:nucleotidyl transferase AbiEii/AbiGii toxin family protein [Actinomadura flavalba]
MTSWDEIGFGPWPADRIIPQARPDAATRARAGLPATVGPVPGARQPMVFDPALKQHARAVRAGEPRFTDPAVQARWLAARRRARDHVLAAIAASPWREHLVLRGSVLLRAWYGDDAREPGDLDFVVVPGDWELDDPRTAALFKDVAAGAEALSGGDDVRVDATEVLSDEIWTYDRVPGRRLVLGWHAGGLEGSVQLDFVFGELLPVPPEPTVLPGGVELLGATRELSLAWKVMWVLNDMYPQGKDAYDALLLARDTTLTYRLLARVYVAADASDLHRLPRASDLGPDVDWDEFAKEYPGLPGGVADAARLRAFLTPLLTGATGLPEDPHDRAVELLRPRIAHYAGVLAREGMDGVVRRMAGPDRVWFPEATVIVLALRGRDRADAPAVLDEVMRGYAAADERWARYLRRSPRARDLALDRLR